MDSNNNNTILNMEASLLQNRIKAWYYDSVGKDIALYNNQEDTIQHALRFTNTLSVALELTGDLFNHQVTVKFLLANTLRMLERRAKLVGVSSSNTIDPSSFIAHTRKRFNASLSLFRFMISPSYLNTPKDFRTPLLQQLGGEALFVWGESLLCFAECSLKYWKPQYINVLKLAEARLVQCLQASPHMHQAHFALGNILLLQAKAEVALSPPFLNIVHRAKDEFFAASQNLHGVKAYNFNFIRACALLGQEQELSQLLPSFVSTFPDNAAILLAESDFDHYRSQKWFHVLIDRASNPQLSKLPYQPLPPQPSQARPLPPPHTQPPQLSNPTAQPKQQAPQKLQNQTHQISQKQQPVPPHLDPNHPLHNIADYQLLNSYPPPVQPYPEVPYMVYPDPYAYQPMSTIPPPVITAPVRADSTAGRQYMPYYTSSHLKTGIEERQYGELQSSLIESGFSVKRLLEVFSWLPVSSGIFQAQPEEENEHVKKQKQRLKERLELYQLKPKREIPGDGNCQMHAVSDQLYDTIDRSKDVRKMVVDWLRMNKMWKLPNGSVLHEFVHDKPWEEYCTTMEKDGCWGDHLTLLAISEIFGSVISIMSSVEGDNFITEIHPTTKKTNKVILLSHYAEFHYGSLTHIGETLK